MPLWGPNRFWPGSGLVLRCLGPGFTVLALGPGFRPIVIIIIINDITIEVNNKISNHCSRCQDITKN